MKVSRYGSAVVLQLDGGEGRRYNETFSFQGHQLLSVDKQEGVFAGGPTHYIGGKDSLVVTSFQNGNELHSVVIILFGQWFTKQNDFTHDFPLK